MACPYCGFRLEPGTQAKQLYRKGGKSIFLKVLTVLTLVAGIIGIVQGASESTFQFANFMYQGPIPDLARYLALFQVPIGIVLAVVGVLQLLIFYGLIYGKVFARRYLLRAATIAFFLAFVMLSLDAAISSIFPLPSVIFSSDIFFVVWTLVLLTAIYRYVSQQEVREILRTTGEPQQI